MLVKYLVKYNLWNGFVKRMIIYIPSIPLLTFGNTVDTVKDMNCFENKWPENMEIYIIETAYNITIVTTLTTHKI